MTLPDCLYLWFTRYSPLSFEVVEKTEQMYKAFWPPFLGETTTTFLRQIGLPFGKVWLSSVCWSPSMKPGNDIESRIYGGWVKLRYNFKPFVYTKVHDISRQCSRPLVVSNALARLCTSCFIPKIQAVKIAAKLRDRRKKVVLSPRFVGEGYTPDFGHTFSNRTHFRACGRFWLSSIQRSRRVADEKT